MKLTTEQLNEGRELLRQQDLQGFDAWMVTHHIAIDRAMVLRTFQQCFEGHAPERALRLFDSVFPGIDPARQTAVALLRLASALVMLAGSLAGFVWMLRGCG
jgi:hypothetical protein